MNAELVALAEKLSSLRRRLAPPGSFREKLARCFYVPLLNRYTAESDTASAVEPTLSSPPPVVVSRWSGFHEKAALIGEDPRILIVNMAHLGDFILALPAARRIRNAFPRSHMTLVCATWNVEWAKEFELFDEIIPFDFFTQLNRNWTGPTPEHYRRFEELGLNGYDLAVDLRHDGDTRPCLYRVGAKLRIGFQAPVEDGYPYLDLVLPGVEGIKIREGLRFSWHAQARFDLIASVVISTFARKSAEHPIAGLVRATPEPTGRYAIVALGAGDPIRAWHLSNHIETARILIEKHDLDVQVLGGNAEKAAAEALVAQMPPGRATARINHPLRELPTLVAGASVFIGHGSGITHMAAALGVPTVAILSGVSPLEVWHPAGPHTVCVTGRVPCSPCGLREWSQCPHGAICIGRISVADVLGAAEAIMKRRHDAI